MTGSDDERTDADGKLAQTKRRCVECHHVVGCGDDPDTTADHFALNACDDRLRALRHRQNDAREAHKEFFAGY